MQVNPAGAPAPSFGTNPATAAVQADLNAFQALYQNGTIPGLPLGMDIHQAHVSDIRSALEAFVQQFQTDLTNMFGKAGVPPAVQTAFNTLSTNMQRIIVEGLGSFSSSDFWIQRKDTDNPQDAFKQWMTTVDTRLDVPGAWIAFQNVMRPYT